MIEPMTDLFDGTGMDCLAGAKIDGVIILQGSFSEWAALAILRQRDFISQQDDTIRELRQREGNNKLRSDRADLRRGEEKAAEARVKELEAKNEWLTRALKKSGRNLLSSTKITDAMVEAGARAFHEHGRMPGEGGYDELSESRKEVARGWSRAILTAALAALPPPTIADVELAALARELLTGRKEGAK